MSMWSAIISKVPNWVGVQKLMLAKLTGHFFTDKVGFQKSIDGNNELKDPHTNFMYHGKHYSNIHEYNN